MKWGVVILCLILVFCALGSSYPSTVKGESQQDTRDVLAALATTEEVAATTELVMNYKREEEPTEEPIPGGEEPEEEGHETGPMETSERTSIFFIVTFLIVVSILFEFLKHLIEHSADESMKPIVEGLFRELTVLGFVALVMFLVTQGDGIKHLSKKVFGEDEEMTELIELIHFMLFGMMIMFIIEVVILVRLAIRSEHQWRNREMKVKSQVALDRCYNIVKDGKPPPRLKKYLNIMSAQEKEYVEANSTLQYANMREIFIKDSFEFNEYLTLCLSKQLEDIVEIHPITWVIVDIFVFAMWGVLAAPRIVWIVLTTIFPYWLLLISFLATRKLHWIRKQLVLQPSSTFELSLVDNDTSPSEMVPAYRHNHPKPRSKLGRKIMGAPANLHQQLFWFDKHGPTFHSQFLRVLLLMTAIYVCVFAAFVSRVTLWKYNGGATAAVIILGYLPVFFLIGYIFPRYVSIEMMKNADVVSDVLQKSSIKKLVRMVKFISSLKSTLKNIKLAQETVKLTRGDLESGASQMADISDEFKEEMRLAFDLFDSDHSGQVSRQEFHELMEMMGYKSTPAELDNIMKIIDVDGDGEISFQEFTVFSYEVGKTSAPSKGETIDEFIDTAFSIFDADGSGHVTKAEFTGVLTKIYPEINIDAANDIADEIDHDRSGTIEKHDFAKIIKRHMQELKKTKTKKSKM